MNKKKIAFDVDHTIWKIEKGADGRPHQVPDYDLIQVLRWFHNNGDEVYVWSAGGVDYAKTIVHKLGLDHIVTVIPKGIYGEPESGLKMDISFDDEEVNLASVNIKVSREPIENHENNV